MALAVFQADTRRQLDGRPSDALKSASLDGIASGGTGYVRARLDGGVWVPDPEGVHVYVWEEEEEV